MNRVSYFNLVVDNVEKTKEFYEKTLGWKFVKWEGLMEYWGIITGEGQGIDGGLSPRSEGKFNQMTIDVENLDEMVKTIVENGGEIITPKMEIPKVGFFAAFKDKEGNSFGLMENHEKM